MREGNHIKERVKSKYLQHYKDKLNINSIVRVRPPTDDNLAALTTKQLDDYILLEKNRYDRDRQRAIGKSKRLSALDQPQGLQKSRYTHSKIYQSSFLARLNKMVGEQRQQKESYQQYTQQNFLRTETSIKKSDKSSASGFLVRPNKKLDFEEYDIAPDRLIEDLPCAVDSDNLIVPTVNSRTRIKSTHQPLQWFEGMSKSLLNKSTKKEEPTIRGMDLDKTMTNSIRSKFRVKTRAF